jgi:putative ABC transport system permease protein
MIRNYLKIAFRTITKNRTYALLNVAGLSLGLASALLIFAFVRYHFSIDQEHTNGNRIYRISSQFIASDGDKSNNPGVPFPFGKAMKTDYPQIEQLAMIERFYEPRVVIEEKGKTKKFQRSGGREMAAFIEPSFFKIFDYQWIEGNADGIKNPNTVVLSKKIAEKLFGTTQCVGKLMKLEGRLNLKVVGVFNDHKDNTDFQYQIMPSYASLREFFGGGELDNNFGNTNSSTQCFVLLNDKFTKVDWDNQMVNFIKKHKPEGVKDTRFLMTNIKESHFSPDFGSVNKSIIMVLFMIGVFLILTACINFVNLATAQALKRSKEVGVRKVLGSTKTQLFWQFIIETGIITLVATCISLILFDMATPLIQSQSSGIFKFTFYFSPAIPLYLLGLIVFVVLLSGVYPAMILGGFEPVKALKGRITTQQLGGFSVRRGLIVMQFAISQILIIGMIVVASQLNYFNSKDLGFKKEAIVIVPLPTVNEQDVIKMNTYRNMLSGLSGVEKVSFSTSGPPQTNWTSETTFKFDNRPENEDFAIQSKDMDNAYLDLYGIKIVAGKNILRSDTARETLVNETLVRKLGFKNPNDILSKELHLRGMNLPIVGVVKDFHLNSLRKNIAPVFITSNLKDCHFVNLQLRSGNFPNTMKSIEKVYDQIYPDSFFESQFVDTQINEQYMGEMIMSKLINLFAFIAILIGCLGLYGLVTFMAAQKTKEIGIRKVLGATEFQILNLFGKEFGKLILIAFAIAAPTAWWVMNKWLQNYEYRINIGVGIFLLAIGITVLIASITVGYRSLKAAWANPVKSLRTE